MTMIPGAAGLNYDTCADATEDYDTCTADTTEELKVIYADDDEPETEGLLDRTIIRGVVLFPRSTIGGDFRFFALRIHYTTFYLGGIKKGTIMLRSVTLSDVPKGIVGDFYIIGTFRGNLDSYT